MFLINLEVRALKEVDFDSHCQLRGSKVQQKKVNETPSFYNALTLPLGIFQRFFACKEIGRSQALHLNAIRKSLLHAEFNNMSGDILATSDRFWRRDSLYMKY